MCVGGGLKVGGGSAESGRGCAEVGEGANFYSIKHYKICAYFGDKKVKCANMGEGLRCLCYHPSLDIKRIRNFFTVAEKMSECVACLCYGCVHAKDSRLMLALDQVRFCISRICGQSGDHGTVRERGRFGGGVMSWIRNTDVPPGKSGSLM